MRSNITMLLLIIIGWILGITLIVSGFINHHYVVMSVGIVGLIMNIYYYVQYRQRSRED
ncbi:MULTISPECIES: hypothetical protein [Staphylococcus]|nr:MULTISPECIES: hypothetical protein [Staphylococcus]EHM71897.1 hypothetical protein SEVCU012_2355 [Staphylococcus pettenkoferi VCU012]MBX8992997.1 hypothetical protein [Staphylococcus pettenkoferi]MCI2790792.1 hypothetical protein [Staphylococcus pettenkoferi]MCY1565688.1 hypothetical protein [Staphylococcus pettenkoferi]MCY1567037.1 hypothetical protein [Staphylococcus pettenkoferi]